MSFHEGELPDGKPNCKLCMKIDLRYSPSHVIAISLFSTPLNTAQA